MTVFQLKSVPRRPAEAQHLRPLSHPSLSPTLPSRCGHLSSPPAPPPAGGGSCNLRRQSHSPRPASRRPAVVLVWRSEWGRARGRAFGGVLVTWDGAGFTQILVSIESVLGGERGWIWTGLNIWGSRPQMLRAIVGG